MKSSLKQSEKANCWHETGCPVPNFSPESTNNRHECILSEWVHEWVHEWVRGWWADSFVFPFVRCLVVVKWNKNQNDKKLINLFDLLLLFLSFSNTQMSNGVNAKDSPHHHIHINWVSEWGLWGHKYVLNSVLRNGSNPTKKRRNNEKNYACKAINSNFIAFRDPYTILVFILALTLTRALVLTLMGKETRMCHNKKQTRNNILSLFIVSD